jgi:C-terminal processing protease CtpA/Prc
LGLGPLIGTRTWGGVVGINDHGPMIDGGQIFVPEAGSVSLEGQWIIEGHGVDPDIVVENDVKSVLDGRDPQLERGHKSLSSLGDAWNDLTTGNHRQELDLVSWGPFGVVYFYKRRTEGRLP